MKLVNYLHKFLHLAHGMNLGMAAWSMPNEKEERIVVGNIEEFHDFDNILSTRGFLFAPFDRKEQNKSIIIKHGLEFSTEHGLIGSDNLQEKLDQLPGTSFSIANLQEQNNGSTAKQEYMDGVREILDKIEKEGFIKVVLSARKHVSLDENFSVSSLWDDLKCNHPEAFLSMVYLPGKEIWMGVSPEFLIRANQKVIRTLALAGTKNGTKGEGMKWQGKNKREQAIVCDYIEDCLQSFGLSDFEKLENQTISTGKLKHLQTEYQIPYDVNKGKMGELISALHPGPAICGTPSEMASEQIRKLEASNREYYAGFLGPVGFDGKFDLFVNLRCMKLAKKGAMLFAGAGIVEKSDPRDEWEEVQLKFGTLLDMLKKSNFLV